MDNITDTVKGFLKKFTGKDDIPELEKIEAKRLPAPKRRMSKSRAVTAPKKKNNRKIDIATAYKAIVDIVGEEEFSESTKQRDRMGGSRHLFDILNERGSVTYAEIAEKLFSVFSPLIKSLVLIKDHKKVRISSSGNAFIKKDGEEIEIGPVFSPRREHILNAEGKKVAQALFPYDEYVSVVRKIQNKRNSIKTVEEDGVIDEDIAQLKFTFKEIAELAIEKHASDIHISFSSNYYYFSLRRDGDLIGEPDFMLSDTQGTTFLRQMKLEASKYTKGKFNADDNNYPQDARIVYESLGSDLRMAFIPEGTLSGKNAVVARILLKHKIDKNSFSFESMGYNKKFRDQLDEVRRLKGGLVFVTGITGSGKSTLLSHFVATFSEKKRIFTIEDPIEYEIPGANVTQLQIYQPKDGDKAVGFLEYIKILKRADPDVIFLGETRNDPTLVNAIIEASKAGQLVLSTIHISSAFDIYMALETVFGMSSADTISLLLFSVNQVLVKKLCDNCKVEDVEGKNYEVLKKLYDGEKTKYAYTKPLKDFLDKNPKTYIANKEGCPVCREKGVDPGFSGRAPVYEWFRPTVSFREWYHETSPNPILIERKVCENDMGVNKLMTYLGLLEDGLVDTDPDIIDEVM